MNRFQLVVLASLALTHTTLAQHAGDVELTLVDGVIRTNRVDADGVPQPKRVYEAMLGEAGVPHFGDEPGYEAAPGTFPAGMRVGWRCTGAVQRWNGGAFEPTTARVEFAYLTLSFVSGSGPVEGFSLLVQPDGGFHKHLAMTLFDDLGEPEPGAYLVPMQVFGSSPAREGDMYWLVLGDGIADAELDVAVEAARTLYEPPACPGDLDGSGQVDNGDVALALLEFGPCVDCASDLDGTGEVDFGDVALILLGTGPC